MRTRRRGRVRQDLISIVMTLPWNRKTVWEVRWGRHVDAAATSLVFCYAEIRVPVFIKEKNRMKNRGTEQHHITRRIRLIACTGALATAFMVALPQVGHAQTENQTSLSVPGTLQPLAGNEVFLVAHAFGSQDYVCAASGSGVAFVLTTPEAVLFDVPGHRVINHFFSPNPVEDGTIRASWQSTRNSSVFWGKLVKAENAATAPDFVAKDAIAWLLLSQAGVLPGTAGGDDLSVATFVQRINTVGGLAPSTGCNSLDDIRNTAFVPYEADYVFFTNPTATAAVPERN
jgi:Protein of unknown function (DUF3455)